MSNPLLAPFAFLYGIGVFVRNKMFDLGLLASREFDIPIICVGNITVGGTGKTPMAEFLIANLSQHFNVALLSRGYKRRTKGFLEVQTSTPFLQSGDEPKQIKLKFPDVVVAVCEKRGLGIDRILEEHPQVNLVILDDAFQHRQVEPWANIVLMDYNRPIWQDHLLPWGNLRDNASQMHRANFVVVTKCDPVMNALEMRLVRKYLGLYAYQSLFFSEMHNGAPTPLFPDCAQGDINPGAPIIVMAGVASPTPLIESLGKQYKIVDKLIYPDHHPYRMRDLNKMLRALEDAPQDTVIVTTEKDAVKLLNRRRVPVEIQERLYFVPVWLEFTEGTEREFLRKLYQYVRSNQKYSLLHSD